MAKYVHRASRVEGEAETVLEGTVFTCTCWWHPENGDVQLIEWRDAKRHEYERVERGDVLMQYDVNSYTRKKFVVPRLLVRTLYAPHVAPPDRGGAEPAF